MVEPTAQTVPFLFNSPHSGRRYPASFLAASRLDERTIRRSEDSYVDELFLSAVGHGAPLLRAHFPRAWLDVNREPFELDPKMFRGALPSYANVKSARVSGGLGTIARVVAESEEIYPGPIEVEDALARIDAVYMPYHRTLRRLLARIHGAFGVAVLVDCHSMPSTVRGAGLRGRPDFVLGDRHGTSCEGALTDLFEGLLIRRGYDVSRNRPYAGGFITEHYGQPQKGIHALQIEVNRGLYLNERSLAKTAGFQRLAADIGAVIAEAGAAAWDRILPPAEAAE
ncbi:MAG: N-formylglutamate amidohydrolase [Bauldia sp.]|nr:N-formylglutamate amidohydrolase [Bauldia sp.]